jgi:hypothetical protein
VDDDFEICWKCRQVKPSSPTLTSEPREPSPEWTANFHGTRQLDGTTAIQAFGRPLTCAVCANGTFRKHSTLLNTGLVGKSATNFVCSRCGYIFWFFPQ